MSMCPIVSACGTAKYITAKFITKIFTNYCGKTSFLVKDRTDITQKIKHLLINPEEKTLVSFNVSALFSIQVPAAQQIINSKISTCTNFTNFCKIPTEKFIKLLEYTTTNCNFSSFRNFINNYRVQPWAYLSPLSLQISTWNTLNP